MVFECGRVGADRSVFRAGGGEIGVLVCDGVDDEEGDLDLSEFV